MKVVKFVRNAPPYMAGELAGFPDGQADKLVASGAAVPHTTESGGATPKPTTGDSQAAKAKNTKG